MAVAGDNYSEPARGEMGSIYSQAVLDHAASPRNFGDMEGADGHAVITGPCGDTMAIWLKVQDNTVVRAAFTTDGCGTTLAAGSMVTEMAANRGIGQVLRIGQQDVLSALGGLPPESEHCALLAADTLRKAVEDYIALKREPWKGMYKKR
ncbi:iron-sulfur cluster assembly scaffold protein [Chloroflexota bacterium]